MNQKEVYTKEEILKWLDDEAEYYINQVQQRLERQDLKEAEDCLKINYAANILKNNFQIMM